MSTRANTLAGNFVYFLLADLAQRGVAFAVILVLARLVSVDQFGIYTFAITAGIVLSSIADLGLTNFVLRDLSIRPEKRSEYLRLLLPARFALSGIVLILYLVLVAFAPVAQYGIIIALFALSSLIEIQSTFIISFYRSNDEAKPILYVKLIGAILTVITFVLALLWLRDASKGSVGLLVVALTMLMTNLVVLALLINAKALKWSTISLPSINTWQLPSIKYLTKILKVSIFFLLPAFLYILIIRGNIFFLATLQTTRDVGLFNSALTVMSVFLVLVSLFTYVFYTSITRAALQPKNQQAMKFIVKYLLLLSLPAVSVLIFLSEHIMQLTFGTEYVVAGTALAIMSAALPVLFLNAVLQIMLLALDLEKLLTTIIGCVALITVGASYFLISQYGIDGAAAATVIAEVLIFSISLYYVRRAGIKFSADLTVLRIIFANVFFALVLAALPAPWLFKLIASILVYTICVLLLGILTRADLQWFSEVRALNGIINRVKSTRLEKWFFRE